jgi:hypothetical protein
MSAKIYMEGKINININVPIVLKSGSLKLLKPQGLSRPVIGLLYLCFAFQI